MGTSYSKSKAPAEGKRRRSSGYADEMNETKPSEEREPLLDFGKQRLTFVSIQEQPRRAGKNEWIKAVFTYAKGKNKGDEAAQLFCMSGKSRDTSLRRLKSLCIALTGDEDVPGAYLDHLLGIDEDGDKKLAKLAAKAVGTEIGAKVSKGGETDDGDFYRNISFFPVDGDEDAEEEDEDEEEDEAPPARKGKASKRPAPQDDEDEEEDEDAEEEDEDEEDADEEEEDEEPAPRRSKKKASRR